MQVIVAIKPGCGRNISLNQPAAVVLDPSRQCIWRSGAWIMLDPSKFNVAFVIMSRRGGVVPKDDVCDHLWGDDPDGGPDTQWRIIDVHLCKMRRHLPDLGITIETVWGRGYRLVEMSQVPAKRRAA